MNNLEKLAEHLKSAVEVLNAERCYSREELYESMAKEEAKPQYRLLEAGEIIMKGDECCSGNLWYDVNHGAIGQGLYESNVGRYRRLVVNEIEYPSKYEMEELGEQRAMALDAAVESNAMADELKKAKADLFAYGEFTTNVAAALGMGTYEISFADVIDRIRLEREAYIQKLKDQREKLNAIEQATCKLRGYKAINSRDPASCISDAAAVIQDKEACLRRLKEKLENAATYVEGLERDLVFHIDATNAAIADADLYREQVTALENKYNRAIDLIQGYLDGKKMH